MARTLGIVWTCVLALALGVLGCGRADGAPTDEDTGRVSSALAPMVVSVTVTPNAGLSYPPGTVQTFQATADYSNGSHKALGPAAIWSGGDPTVSAVNVFGDVTMRAAGTSWVMAKDATSGKFGTAVFRVTTATLTSIAVTPAGQSLPVGTTQKYTATGTFSDSTTAPLTGSVIAWSSNAPAVATIATSTGIATAIASGITTIRATHVPTGRTGTAALSVGSVTLTSLAVTPANPSIATGTTTQLTAAAAYSDGTVVDVTATTTWKSSKTTIATIAAGGLATAVAPGTSTVSAVFGGKTTLTTLTVVPVRLVSLALTPPAPKLWLGSSASLVATGTFNDNTTSDLTELVDWTSSDTSILTVSNATGERGKLTSVGVGFAMVMAKHTVTGVSSTITVEVDAVTLASISVSRPLATLAGGLSEQFTATGLYSDGSARPLTTVVTWSTSSTARTSVSNAAGTQGVVKALNAPSPTGFLITISAIEPATGIVGSATVTIVPAFIASVAITPVNVSVPIGLTSQLRATATYTDGRTQSVTTQCSWVSSDSAVASVAPFGSLSGQVTALALGTSQIRATLPPTPSSPAMTALAFVNVTAAVVTKITMLPAAEASLPKTLTQQYRARLDLSDGTTRDGTDDVTWAAEPVDVLAVSNVPGSKGLVTGLAVGTGAIYVVYPPTGTQAGATVTVTHQPISFVDLQPAAPTLPAGTTIRLSAIAHYTDGTTADITRTSAWWSDNPAVATVASGEPDGGKLDALTAGTTLLHLGGPEIDEQLLVVTVTPAVLRSIAIAGPAALDAGQAASFTADGLYSDGSHVDLTAQVTWTSSDTSGLTISNADGSHGLATATRSGNVTLTALDAASAVSGTRALTVTGVRPMIATGVDHACALLANGRIKCWGGAGGLGLGLGWLDRGDEAGELGANEQYVDLGAGVTARAIAAGNSFTCAITSDGRVKCFGNNSSGQLGLGDTRVRGVNPGEMGASLPYVDLGAGAVATSITARDAHACVVLGDGRVKCWGQNILGSLGLGDQLDRGGSPGQMGNALPAVDLGLGRIAKRVRAGQTTTCAVLDDDTVKCWGDNRFAGLGAGTGAFYDATTSRGDDPGEMGDALARVDLGTGVRAEHIAVDSGACVITTAHQVKCWGFNDSGQLGIGDTRPRGYFPADMGDALPFVDLGTGRLAVDLVTGPTHTCAILDDGHVRCWGSRFAGELGLGNDTAHGSTANSMGDALPNVDLGTNRNAVALSAGNYFTCALLDDGTVKCWGWNNRGQLGIGDTISHGGDTACVPADPWNSNLCAQGPMGDLLPAVDLSAPGDLSSDASNCGAFGHSCLGGACVASVCQPVVLATGHPSAWDVRVQNGVVSWNDYGAPNVFQVPASGGAVTSIPTAGTVMTIALDSSSLLWGEHEPDGTSLINLTPLAGGPVTSLLTTYTGAHGIATDANYVYDAGYYFIRRTPRAGGPSDFVVTGLAMRQVAVDDAFVYWTEYQSNGTVSRAPKTGGDAVALATGQEVGYGIAVRDGYVYWGAAGQGHISRVPVTGGASELLVDLSGGYGRAVVVDDANVYFSSIVSSGEVRVVPRNGGTARTLATGLADAPWGIAVDTTAVYFTDAQGGRVMKVAK